MQERRVGRSGLMVSRLGLGTSSWGARTDAHEAADLLTTFLEAGGTLVEAVSGSAGEEVAGSLLAGVPRGGHVLAVRSGSGDLSRRTLLAELDASLVHLGTDHVDLWLVGPFDARTPLEETVSVLAGAVTTGRARYVGVSGFSAWQAVRAHGLLDRTGLPLVADAVGLSLLERGAEGELTSAAEGVGFGLLAGSPLAAGVLAARYRSTVPADSRLAGGDPEVEGHLGGRSQGVVEAVSTAATGLGVSAAAVALAWARDRPGVCATLAAPRTVAQLAALLATEDLVLPDEIVRALDDVSSR